ncbi:pC129R [African swine fever virus]|uniref:PC129R n=1 Tax=African swine fever virus TaxID=10497 RepID=A0A2Z5DGU6_ASF|nr:pC129R [African swine fever virus]AXB49465.1 pC129R [African swine fever virus]AXB49637.1 pC129R [African swine fever virus]AXB49981.1 pC129R [African swine fever virus]
MEHPSTNYTPEQQHEKLKHYILIPKHLWCYIKYGTHVRYYTTQNVFRVGGFVLQNPYEAVIKNEVKTAIRLQNNFNTKAKGHVTWTVPYDDISKLYAKPDAIMLTIQENVEKALHALNQNVLTLAAKIR